MIGGVSERVIEILEWGSVTGELVKRCATAPGAARASSLKPIPKERIKQQLRKITEIKELMGRGESPDFSGVDDISPWLDLAMKGGALKLSDLIRIRSFIIASRGIRGFLQRHREFLPAFSGERDSLDPLDETGGELIPAITDNGDLNPARFPELRRIRDEIYTTRQEIEKSLSSLMSAPSVEKALQERLFTTRNDRYVILVKAGMKQNVRGCALDISSSGQTLYIEPYEILPLNNRLIALSMDLQIEINRILQQLSKAVKDGAPQLGANLSVIAGIDMLHAAGGFSAAIRGSEPEIADEPLVRLYAARHPLLYLMNPGNVVPNDVALGEDYNCLLLSGANTGGKTVLLKTVGLCAMLAMHGLHIPAGPDSRVGIFSGIMADIGDDQSIAQSLSSYSGQIVILKEMVEKAGSATLILIDEIVVGTNPRQGAALAQALMERMITTGAKIVVTTHYSELKELASRDGRFRNASVAFDLDTLKPTYRMATGIPGVSYTLEIARIYGIREEILSRARELLDEREISIEALIEKMQKYDQEITAERLSLEAMREELGREKSHYQDMQRKLDAAMEEIKQEKGILFLEDLKMYREQIAGRIRELQGADMRQAGKLRHDVGFMQEKVSGRLKEDSARRYSRTYGPFDPSIARPGMKAFIVSLEKEGVIESLDLHDESAELIIGSSIRARFRFGDLLMKREIEAQKATSGGEKVRARAEARPPEGSATPLTIQTRYNTIDLRGLRADEAIDKMERDLDRMVRTGIGAAVVIHGHGTGALKEAVRNNLRHSAYVNEFRPGRSGEGGDGVSIAYLHQ